MASYLPPPLLNDLYQFTMAEGYLESGIADRAAVFDLFTRRLPFGGGFALAAGIEPALDLITSFRFPEDDLAYLDSLRLFSTRLLERLRSFRFRGDVAAVPEGTPVFPGEPILRVTAPILEAQLLETPLLNLISFSTLIATKAARLAFAAGGREIVDFGCRRAQGPNGALLAARSAFIGGCGSTSNLEAGKTFGIEVRGTMAHSWVLAFPDEPSAFRAYARSYPDSSTFLVDTFDTLGSGVPNAIAVAREMRLAGRELRAIRLDSGDFQELSRRARAALDAAGFQGVKVLASGDLDEHRIEALIQGGAPIDAFGVGTRLNAAHGDPALSTAYKLAALEAEKTGAGGRHLEARMKISDEPGKATLPGEKQVFRFSDGSDFFQGDAIALSGDDPRSLPAPSGAGAGSWALLLEPAIRGGERSRAQRPLAQIRAGAAASLERLPGPHRRLRDPEPYPVALSPALEKLFAALRAGVRP